MSVHIPTYKKAGESWLVVCRCGSFARTGDLCSVESAWFRHVLSEM